MPEPLPSKKPGAEILQFLKREEVRTMAKDIAQLREQEAKKERERIASLREIPQSGTKLKAEESKSKKEAVSASTLAPNPQPPSLMPHANGQKPVFLRAKTRSEKILIRAIVIGILLFILLNGITFGYWYLTKKKAAEVVPDTKPTPEATESNAEPGTGNQVSAGNLVSTPPAPASVVFFETLQEKTIDLGVADNFITLLSSALKEEYPQGFTRILIKNTESSASLTTREFLEKASVVMPESLLSLLNEDFMLFVYSSPGRKRLGILTELSQIADTKQERSTEGAQDMLRSWETTLEQDTKALWEIVGQKGSAYTPLFRQTAHQNSLVRFQTFSVIDFGVVYTLFGDKLVLTTSFESLTKAVDQIIQNRQ